MKSAKKIDRVLLIVVGLLVFGGFIVFLSASLGLTAKNSATYSSVVFNQLFFGLILGGITAFVVSRVDFTFWKKVSLYLFIIAIILTLLVFVPNFGFESGGAKRWLSLGPLSFQPAEFLKVAFVLYFATWLSGVKDYVQKFKFGLLPLIIILSIVGVVLLNQPDTSTFIMIVVAGFSMFFVSGGRWRHILLLVLIGIIGLSGLIVARPYVKDRILTFVNPAENALTSGYQIQQSLIAVGSGSVFGRGFGQSIQKFNFLPEPIGDSIFAVFAEEFGFIGAFVLILLFTIFALRGFKVASKIKDPFGGLVLVGLVIMITVQSFMNIGAMLGVIPLSGLPLLFVSHGGTALFFTLFAIGIIFNISRHQTN